MFYIGNSIIKGTEIAPLTDQRITGENGEVYELFRVEDGKPLFLDEHLDRFVKSIIDMDRVLPEAFGKLPELIDWLILVNGLRNCNVRLCLSPDGLFQGGFVPSEYPSPKMYTDGVRCIVLQAIRRQPTAKIYHAEMRKEAELQQERHGVYESILINNSRMVTEGSRSNLFFVKGDTLYTAPDDKVLGGIVRKKLIELSERNNIKIEFSTIMVDDLVEYEAAFITSTPARILPISAILGVKNAKYDVQNTVMRRVMDLMEEEVRRSKGVNMK
jgi:branched-chain amino acid aminotransferase